MKQFFMKRYVMILLPFAVIAVGALTAWTMINSREVAETRPREVSPPLVRVIRAEKENIRLRVHSEGTVMPRTQSTLIPEVAGTLVWVSPSLTAGSFFESGKLLLKIDPREYELDVISARAAVAGQKLRLEWEKQEADVARQEWEKLGNGTPTNLALRKPQLAEAEAALASATAALERAKLNLEKTKIYAPYAGRVRTESVDMGQFVTRGTPIARVYAVDYAEVRLPIPDQDAAFLRLPLNYRGEKTSPPGPSVTLKAKFAGKEYRWRGRIVRTEGEIDAKSRMIHAVAQVKNPYGRGGQTGRPPLAVGMFVEAEIQGLAVRDVVVLPRTAFRTEDTVLVVDDEARLHFRQVEVLQRNREQVYVTAGLENGERICISPMDTPVENMRVRIGSSGTASDPPDNATGNSTGLSEEKG